MEIKGAIHINKKLVHFCCISVLLFATAFCLEVSGQSSLKTYTVKNGKMFISLAKQLNESSLDSFISQYDLRDLALKEFIKNGFRDSLVKFGWTIETDNNTAIMVSKPLLGVENLKNPAERIMFAEKQADLSIRFPAVSSKVIYGYNRFRNKSPFAIADSTVTFYLRGNTNAKTVMLGGSFNNWEAGDLAMIKTDSGWIAELKLGPGKYWYKFLIDGKWVTDSDNRLNENDGLGNVNSVFYKSNVVFRLNGYSNSKRVYLSSSFNNWDPNELLMNKTAAGWELPLYIADGTYTYRFVADRNWFADPANPEKYPNEFGEFNSVLRLGKPYLFYLEGYTNAQQVILTGSFNGWRKDELFMKKTAKGWELPYTLGAGNYEYHYIIDGKLEVKQVNPDSLTGSGNARNFYFVIDPDYKFRLKGYSNAKSVYLAGDFNNWSPNTFAMTKEGDEWVLPVHLSKGKHSYKFVVDGKWIIDPDNKLWEQNEFDTGNSVIWIGR
jgi:Glycogen recognition site of AMP-activated protein kinase